MTLAAPPESAIARRIGKPFDYARLGRAFSSGAAFMRDMRAAAEDALRDAGARNAIHSLQKCPICDETRFDEFLQLFGYTYSRCATETCRHVFVSTRLDAETRQRFFTRSGVYSAGYRDDRQLAFRIEQIARPKVDFVTSHASARRGAWLDVGCGGGEILAEAGRRGWDGVGLELSADSAEFGRTRLGVDIRQEALETHAATRSGAVYDVVSMFGVAHCLEDPVSFVQTAAGLLAPNGVMALELSNADSVTADAVRSFPQHATRSSFSPLTTLHQFTDTSAARLCAHAGLRICAVWQYGTDAFEALNQLHFAIPDFERTPLCAALLDAAPAIQAHWDSTGRGSHRLWIARREDAQH